jgi:hypothetical protein
VLRWHDEWWRNTFTRMLRERGGDRPRDQLLAVFDALDHLFCSDEYNGCIFVNVAVEFPVPHDPAHQLAAAHKRAMEEIIRQLAAYAGADDPAAFAAEFTLIMEGSYVTQHVDRSPEKTAAAQRVARMLVEKHMP